MPRPVSYRADVRRRVMQVLVAIVPDLPVPTRLLSDIISLDSLTGGPYDSIGANLSVAGRATLAGVIGAGIPDEIIQDTKRKTITITTAGQSLLREQLKRLPPTPQARARARNGLDNVVSSLLVQMFEYASCCPGTTSHHALTPDHVALLAPHFFQLSRAELAQPGDDWGPAQNLATLWMLNDHGVIPEHLLAEHTHELVRVCDRYYRNWRWEAVSMLLQSVDKMMDARWSEAGHIGERLLIIAEEITLGVIVIGNWFAPFCRHTLGLVCC